MKYQYTEEDVQSALKDIEGGKSVRKAQLDWGVPRSTLQNRTYGHVSRKEAQEPYQRLSIVQENKLAEWVLTQESIGSNPTHAQVRALQGEFWILERMQNLLGSAGCPVFFAEILFLRLKSNLKSILHVLILQRPIF
jgi:4-hydroxybenzoate polyprenyltransferase